MVNQYSFNLMANYKFELPFKLGRPCRCSFVVRLDDGRNAFISNENLFYLSQNPGCEFEVIDRNYRNGRTQPWIVVAKTEWTLGFKKPMFGPDGHRI